jgi:hypothetical protein
VPVLRIGDAKLPRDVRQSVNDAATTAWSLNLAISRAWHWFGA